MQLAIQEIKKFKIIITLLYKAISLWGLTQRRPLLQFPLIVLLVVFSSVHGEAIIVMFFLPCCFVY